MLSPPPDAADDGTHRGLADRLAAMPRVPLGHLPTPLERLDRLSETLGGPEIWIKRDDCTGLATGGNKTRKLEFLVADARRLGCDTLVTVGKLQSNHARQTAAAAAKVGMACVLLLERLPGDVPDEYLGSGNVLLDELLGAAVEVYDPDERTPEVVAGRLAAIRADGRSPYSIPSGGSNGIGALGYVAAAIETEMQARTMGADFDRVVLASGSGGTQAGWVLGTMSPGDPSSVIGVSVSPDRSTLVDKVAGVADECAHVLGWPPVPSNQITVDDGYIGPGYGRQDERTFEAIDLLATTEGILLDPVYTGKAAACLIDACRTGRFGPGERVLFLHTGGQAANFAYRTALGGRRR